MDSQDWAQYIESTDGLSQPWLLMPWRLHWLNEQRSTQSPEAYDPEWGHLPQPLMDLGEWWSGQEKQAFGVGEK
ncbi:hypothetical protein [Nodosilinea sp. P-1105]|uniref:hypothetical protein n=1 Tax=Nodosilinea sp. P-1105 TaxID=2546229 RepID=UPI00146B02FB|nr:hypothetical protein [Nodosilinea sp. P-1105]NMF82222.1 hypothetical protein [Nodosilinea sp. P-1105]